MFVQGPVIQGEGSTHPVKSHHTPTSAPSTSQPPISPTSRRINRQESMVPQPRSPTQSPVADEAASTGMDVRYGGATTIVTGLEAGQGSVLLITKLIKKVKKLKNKVKSSQARRRARIIVPDDEDDLEDPSKQGAHVHVWNIFLFLMNAKVFTAEKDVSTAKPVSTAGATITTASVAVSTTKDKAVGSSKRDANEEFDQESSKRQKISESSEPAKEPKDKERELSKRAYNK
ncbi:hypothetical protein Tco_0286784 [Tanacetum coccineum]